MGPAASDAQRQQLTPCDFPVPSWPARDGALHFNHHRVPTEREGEHFPWHLTEIKFHLTLKDLKKIIHHIHLEVFFFLLQISGKGKNTEADSHLNFGDKSTV